MRMIVRSYVLTVCGASLLVTMGCGSSKAVRYYMLNATARHKSTVAGQPSGRTVRVGPVHVPAYLDRQQMVSRIGGNTVKFAQFDRWAEPLQYSIPRVLAANIAAMLPAERVAPLSVSSTGPFDYSVSVDIRRFDGVPGGEAELVAQWTIRERSGRTTVGQTDDPLTTLVPDTTYDALAHAESRLLAEMCQAIVSDIRKLTGSRAD